MNQWESILKNDYAIPRGQSLDDLTDELLGYLGSTDPLLRDEFGYGILTTWIVRDGHYDAATLREMRDRLLANLKVGLGERGSDSVFLRSFSALMLAVIIYRDNAEPFLDEAEIRAVLNAALEYLVSEQDVRGYVGSQGWAHSVAHTADLLKFLARNEKTGTEDHQRILDAVAVKLTTPYNYIYDHDEDERLALAVWDVCKRDRLDADSLKEWVGRLETWKTGQDRPPGFDPSVFTVHQNIKRFLRSLYFLLGKQPARPTNARNLPDRVLKAVRVYNF